MSFLTLIWIFSMIATRGPPITLILLLASFSNSFLGTFISFTLYKYNPFNLSILSPIFSKPFSLNSDLELELIDLVRTMTKNSVGDVAIQDAWKVQWLSSTQLLIKPGEAWVLEFKGKKCVSVFHLPAPVSAHANQGI